MNQALFTPLSLSQLFKEKGVKQESIFRWCLWMSPNGAVLWNKETPQLMTDLSVRDALGIWNKGISAFTLSELPDVFRQVFGGKDFVSTKAQGEWEMFCMMYFNNPKNAWETLEKTIRSL